MARIYEVAIPSRGRAETLSTVELLKGLPANITIFVDEKEDAEKYAKHHDCKIVETGTSGITKARNFILDYYKEGTNVVMLDDDLRGIKTMVGSKLKALDFSQVDTLIRTGFNACVKWNTKLFGIYPIPNAFFMSRSISVNTFIIGTFTGVIVGDLRYDEDLELKEDYDFTLKHILKYKRAIRFNNFCVDAKHYSNAGGCKDRRDADLEQRCVQKLLALYPAFIRINPKRSNEILLSIKSK